MRAAVADDLAFTGDKSQRGTAGSDGASREGASVVAQPEVGRAAPGMMQTKTLSLRQLLAAVSGTLLLVVALLFGLRLVFPVASLQALANAAQVLAAVASGLALAGVVYALILQQAQLQLQHYELTRQAQAMEEQSRTFGLELFEASFFQLLRFNRESAANLSAIFTQFRSEPFKGSEALQKAAAQLLSRARMEVVGPSAEQDLRSLLCSAYEATCLGPDCDFGYHFRNLYHLIGFIDRSQGIDRSRYVKLVRAQMSTAELVLLFFNCCHPRGSGLRPFVEEYSLFKNMALPADLQKYRCLYDPRAFGEEATDADSAEGV